MDIVKCSVCGIRIEVEGITCHPCCAPMAAKTEVQLPIVEKKKPKRRSKKKK